MSTPDSADIPPGLTDPGFPEDASMAVVTFFFPLPAPFPAEDGAELRFARSPTGVDQRPLKVRLWQVADFAEGFLAELRAMSDASRRARGEDPGELGPQEAGSGPGVSGTKTVVEARLSVDLPDELDPGEFLLEGLRQAVGAIAGLTRALRTTRMQPLEVVSVEKLPPVILTEVREADDHPGPPTPWVVPVSSPPLTTAERLGDDELEELQQRYRLMASGFHAHRYRDAFIEAQTALHGRGDTAGAVMWGHVAVEVLLDAVLCTLLWEQGVRPRQAAPKFDRGLKGRVKREYPPLLGGAGWDLEEGPMRAWAGDGGLAQLRNRVVHAGYHPTVEQTREALDAVITIQDFLMGRLRERRHDFPRTAWLAAGSEQLEDPEGLFTGRFAETIEAAADQEPLWTREATAWRDYLYEVLQADHALTGEEVLVLHAGDSDGHRWWVWDPIDESCTPACPPGPPDVTSELTELADRRVDDEEVLVPLPGVTPTPADEVAFGGPPDHGLPALPPRELLPHTPSDLTDGDDLHPQAAKATLCAMIGAHLAHTGRPEAANSAFKTAIGFASRISSPRLAAQTARGIGSRCLMSDTDSDTTKRAFQLAAERYAAHDEQLGEASALVEVAAASHGSDDPAAGCEAARRAAHLFAEAGDLQGQARALSNLASLLTELGELEEAEPNQRQAFELFRQIFDLEGAAKTTVALGRLLAATDRLQEAGEHYLQGAGSFFEAYEPMRAAPVAAGTAAMALRDGLPATASTIVVRTIESARPPEIFDPGGEVVARALGGDWPWAARVDVREAVHDLADELEDNGELVGAAQVLMRLAEIINEDDATQPARALELAQRALRLAHQSGSSLLQLYAVAVASQAAHGSGDYDEALAYADEQFERAIQLDETEGAAAAALNAASLCVELDRVEEAERWADHAEQQGAAIGRLPALRGEIADAQGDSEAARAHWREALEHLDGGSDLRDQVVKLLEDAREASTQN